MGFPRKSLVFSSLQKTTTISSLTPRTLPFVARPAHRHSLTQRPLKLVDELRVQVVAQELTPRSQKLRLLLLMASHLDGRMLGGKWAKGWGMV